MSDQERDAEYREIIGTLGEDDAQKVHEVGRAMIAVLDSHCPGEKEKMIAIAVVTMLRNAVYARWGLVGVNIVPFTVPDGPPKADEV